MVEQRCKWGKWVYKERQTGTHLRCSYCSHHKLTLVLFLFFIVVHRVSLSDLFLRLDCYLIHTEEFEVSRRISELLFVNTTSVLLPDNQQYRKAKIMNIKPTHGNLMNACLEGRVKGVLVTLQKQTSELSSPLK